MAINPNGCWVCGGDQDASVHIWRTADNDELEMAGYPEEVTRLAFDDTGRWIANNSTPELTVWDFLGKGPRGRKPRMLSGHTHVVDLTRRPSTGSILSSVGAEGTTRIWNLTGSAAGKTREAAKVLPHEDAVSVRWLDQSRLVVARAALPHTDVTILTIELACTEPGCPPTETMISLMHPGAPQQFKIPKSLRGVTEADVDRAHAHPAT